MFSVELSYIINELLNFKLEINENETEKKELLYNNIYEKLKIFSEINNCNDLKIKLLNTIKEIFTNYQIHQNQLGKSFNNYIIGIIPNKIRKTTLKNPYNFLRFSCDDFQISKYELSNNNEQINIMRNVFLPIKNVNYDNTDLELTEIIEEIKVIKKSDTKIDIEYNKVTKTYINSILHNITKKTHILNDFYIDKFDEIGFNKAFDIIYNEIHKKDLNPTHNISITRSSHYPDYIEVIQEDKEIKFLTRYNTKKGINSIDDFESPIEETICRKDANMYTTFMQAVGQINSSFYGFLREIDDEQEKSNIKKYYKKINEKIR